MKVRIVAGSFTFEDTFESEGVPETCAWFATLLPFESGVIHARWTGEAVWIPLGELECGLSLENHTAHPSRGDLLFYPGGISETEILFSYGSSSFAEKTGALAGNHFLTITSGSDTRQQSGIRKQQVPCQAIKVPGVAKQLPRNAGGVPERRRRSR